MASSSTPADYSVQTAPDFVRFRSWPLFDEGPRPWLVLLAAALLTALVAWLTDTRLAALAAAVQLVALWNLFVPCWFELTATGVTRRFLGRRLQVPWRAVRRYEVGSQGVVLLTAAASGPAVLRYGLYIPFGNRKDKVLAVLSFYVPQAGNG